MGGSDDPENLVYLSIEEHAEAHRKLYEKHGRWQDRIAWHSLAGLITKEEVLRQMYDERKGEKNYFYGKTHSPETKNKISENRKGKGKGIKQTEEWIEKRKVYGEKNARFGKDPWNKGLSGVQKKSIESKMKVSKPCKYKGVEYWSIKQAALANNTTPYKIKKSPFYEE